MSSYIKQVKISGHSLLEDATLEFAVPDGTKEGSGINYIVGQSGVGKSNFIDAVFRGGQPIAGLPNQRRQSINKVHFPYTTSLTSETGTSYVARGGTFVEIDTNNNKEPTRDFLYPVETITIPGVNGRAETIKQLKNRFGNVYRKTLRLSGSGEGRYNQIMSEIDDISSKPAKIVVIEEPEAYIDPENQLRLLKRLGELAKTKQVFISTHSPYIMDWEYLKNGASVTKINRLGSTSLFGNICNPILMEKIAKTGRRFPHLSGVESKNIFFSNKVLILEGQEDVGIVSRYLNDAGTDYDFSFFGYGAGSSSRIQSVLELCKKLGIQKTAALFDSDPKDDDSYYLESKAQYADYQIDKIDAEDIRDKYETVDGKPSLKKRGAFDQDGNPKNDDLTQDFDAKLKAILEYFKDSHTEGKYAEIRKEISRLTEEMKGYGKGSRAELVTRSEIDKLLLELMSMADKEAFQADDSTPRG